MRIVIDISPIIYGTGVSVYTKNLVENLLKIDTDNDYLLYGGSLRRFSELKRVTSDLAGKSLREVREIIYPFSPTLSDLIWNRLHLFKIDKLIGKADVFHTSDWVEPPSNFFKVTTIHDLVPIKYPELSLPRLISTHRAKLNWVIKESDRIIVPSQATFEDVQALGIDNKRIRIVSEAPDPVFKPSKKVDIERIKRKYRISGKYLVSLGVSPRKNTQRIIEAYERVRADLDLKLVIIGHPYVRPVETRGVQYLGYVSNFDLRDLYSGSDALVYPSLYEGFGLPILEAFACGIPVVTANLGSMKEVAGDAALLVDPKSVDSISDGIISALKGKKTLVKRGTNRVKNFTWEQAALKTLSVYKEAL